MNKYKNQTKTEDRMIQFLRVAKVATDIGNILTNPTKIAKSLETANKVFNLVRQEKELKEYKDLRREVSKRASLANKRVTRLEKQGFNEASKAYRDAFSQGISGKFGIKGLQNKKEVLRELERIDNFLNAQTSTISGLKKYLDGVAKRRGENIPRGGYKAYANKYSNLFRAHERLRQFRDASVPYSSDDEMESINSVIEQLGDEYKYSGDELDAIVELALGEQEQKVDLTRKRRYEGLTLGKRNVISTNKADPIDLNW